MAEKLYANCVPQKLLAAAASGLPLIQPSLEAEAARHAAGAAERINLAKAACAERRARREAREQAL